MDRSQLLRIIAGIVVACFGGYLAHSALHPTVNEQIVFAGIALVGVGLFFVSPSDAKDVIGSVKPLLPWGRKDG